MAHRLGATFIDLDQYIAQQEGKTIPDIFGDPALGEAYFRACESKYLRQVSQTTDDIIISTGGGTPTVGDNMSYMKSEGTVIYLKTDPELLCQRLFHSHTVRPLVVGKSEEELLHFITLSLAKREVYYNQANLVVSNAGLNADRIIELLNYKY